MNYYLLLRYKGELPGHPIFLERTFDKKTGGENTRENAFKVYFTSYQSPPLVFLCKHAKLDFDYYEMSAGEYFVSERLMRATTTVNVQGLTAIDVQLLSTKRKPITTCAYQIIRLRDPVAAVDRERSELVPATSDATQQVLKRLVLDHEALVGHDLFRINDSRLGPFLFCSERFKDASERCGVQVRFIPEAEVAAALAEYDPLAPK